MSCMYSNDGCYNCPNKKECKENDNKRDNNI